jgi:hypothetical protein
MALDIYSLGKSSVLQIYNEKASIWVDPPYQRMGDIWTNDKRQLLIDSILNGFDIPKFYLHRLPRNSREGSSYKYAIIDGRQRLEAIWRFIDSDFALSDDFQYLDNTDVKAAGFTYKELSEKYPRVGQSFDASQLSVYVVDTDDDMDLIEEMFSRLNEAVPLNAAEKRNAFGGPLPKIIREIAEHNFFEWNIKISNRRYQHRDVAAKLLYLESKGEIRDTKKIYIDTFVKENRDSEPEQFGSAIENVKRVLDFMSATFTKNDDLLSSSGMVVVYFWVCRKALSEGWHEGVSRIKFVRFNRVRADNRKLAEEDIAKANYDLLEFDRLMQTPNDAYAIRDRANLLEAFMKEEEAGSNGDNV